MSAAAAFYRITIFGTDGELLYVGSLGPMDKQLRWGHPQLVSNHVLIERMVPAMEQEPGPDQQTWAATEAEL